MSTRILKRLIDIIVSLIGLILTSPIIAIILIIIYLTIKRPIFFKQIRPGLHAKPFVLYKFRTMLDLRDKNGTFLPDEKRLTGFGKFLRKTSLDELPELWNVIKGDMSLVGPRPLLMEYLDRYTPEQARRHEVKPGITGWAQVNGRNAISWEEKFKLDVWYVDNWNILLDIKIIFLTILKVLNGEGISAEGHATMPKFKGTSKG
jgi:lipopolysaccharide/colanic/teichoic acid biosynthesis glycosyltransferase